MTREEGDSRQKLHMGRYLVIEEGVTAKSVERGEQASVRVIRSIPELEALRSRWTSWQYHPNCDIDRYLAVLRSRPEIVRPHVIVISRDGAPNLILVGRLERVPLQARIGYKDVYRPSVRSLSVCYGGILGELTNSNLALLVQTLRQSLASGEADVAWFNSLRLDSPLYPLVAEGSSFMCRDHLPEVNLHWLARLPDSYEEFVRRLSSNTRHNLRRYCGRLQKVFGTQLAVRCFHEKKDLDKVLSDTEIIAAKTYQRGLAVGFVNNAEERRLMSLALDHQQLRAYILYIRDTPCAFWNGLVYGKTFFTGTTGSDPSYREYRPGTFLLTKVLEDMCQNGAAENVDFGFGDAQYKRDFCDNHWHEASLYMFSPTLKGLALNIVRTSTTAIDKAGRSVLDRTKLLTGIKRSWRDLLRPDEGGRPSQKEKP